MTPQLDNREIEQRIESELLAMAKSLEGIYADMKASSELAERAKSLLPSWIHPRSEIRLTEMANQAMSVAMAAALSASNLISLNRLVAKDKWDRH